MLRFRFLPPLSGRFHFLQVLFVILLAFCRILCGAHFLSDVSMGAFITLFLTYIANEVVINQKKLQLPEEAPEQE